MKQKHLFLITSIILFSILTILITLGFNARTQTKNIYNANAVEKTIRFMEIYMGPKKQNITATGSKNLSQYQYFSQCDSRFNNYQLPQGCNMCNSGCGPTTLSMILSTYLKKTITPVDTVEIFKQNNMYAGCDGTTITDAQAILEQQGLQITDLIMLIPMVKEDAISEMKKYTDSGWTLFTLGRYCNSGCSHFFWITKIDDNNKVWSYDPYYNKDIPPPLDVSNYDPFPEYRIAFGVKK